MALITAILFVRVAPSMSLGFSFIVYSLFMLIGNIFLIELTLNLKIISGLMFGLGSILLVIGLQTSGTRAAD
jgi:hypothetical protein